MIYGLAGSSGSGKTTLGHQIAQSLDLTFTQPSITDMSRRAGFNPVDKLDIWQRLYLQKSLYEQFEEMLAGLKGPVILDRTPMDLVMYLMAEIGMHSSDFICDEQLQWAHDYVKRCQRLTERYFDHVFVTTPLPVYDATRAERPPANPAYQIHCHLILMGALYGSEVPFSILHTSDPNQRLDFVSETIVDRLDHIETTRRSSLHLH